MVSPYYLIWDDENYYLLAFDEEADIVKHYRVDKMKELSVVDETRVGKKELEEFDLAAFSKTTFGMFAGEESVVVLRCKNHLAGVIIDRFGKDITMRPVDEECFEARVKVKVSSQFFGWITGLGNSVYIKGPDEVRDKYRAHIENIIKSY